MHHKEWSYEYDTNVLLVYIAFIITFSRCSDDEGRRRKYTNNNIKVRCFQTLWKNRVTKCLFYFYNRTLQTPLKIIGVYDWSHHFIYVVMLINIFYLQICQIVFCLFVSKLKQNKQPPPHPAKNNHTKKHKSPQQNQKVVILFLKVKYNSGTDYLWWR